MAGIKPIIFSVSSVDWLAKNSGGALGGDLTAFLGSPCFQTGILGGLGMQQIGATPPALVEFGRLADAVQLFRRGARAIDHAQGVQIPFDGRANSHERILRFPAHQVELRGYANKPAEPGDGSK